MTNEPVPEPPAWEELARRGEVKEAVLAYVQTYDWVTFAELQNHLEPYCPVEGNVGIEFVHNAVIWCDMSQELADVCTSLMNEKALFLHPANIFSYMADGRMLTLPLARRKPRGQTGYKQPRWFPCCLRTVPLPETPGKRKKGE